MAPIFCAYVEHNVFLILRFFSMCRSRRKKKYILRVVLFVCVFVCVETCVSVVVAKHAGRSIDRPSTKSLHFDARARTRVSSTG